MENIIVVFIHLFALSAGLLFVVFIKLVRMLIRFHKAQQQANEFRAQVETQKNLLIPIMQKSLPASGRRLISSEQCEWCRLRRLADCVNKYCPEHCRKLCSCGAADFAQKMIDEHGSLREAERVLNKLKELKNSGEEIIQWKPEKLPPKVFQAPVEIWKEDDN